MATENGFSSGQGAPTFGISTFFLHSGSTLDKSGELNLFRVMSPGSHEAAQSWHQGSEELVWLNTSRSSCPTSSQNSWAIESITWYLTREKQRCMGSGGTIASVQGATSSCMLMVCSDHLHLFRRWCYKRRWDTLHPTRSRCHNKMSSSTFSQTRHFTVLIEAWNACTTTKCEEGCAFRQFDISKHPHLEARAATTSSLR